MEKMEKTDEFDFSDISESDIKELLKILNPPEKAIPSTRFIITTLIAGKDHKKLRALNKNLDDKTYNFYFDNLERSNYFDEDGKPKINKTDENIIPEIKFARYVADKVFTGKYITKNHYEFEFEPIDKITEKQNKKEIEKELFNYEWLKIIKDSKTGKVYLQKNNSVVIIPFLDKKHVLLEYQYRPAIKKYSFEFPAGAITDEEDLESSINRRLVEETGYISTEIKQLFVSYPSPGIYSSKHYFVAKNVVPFQKAESGINARIFNFNKIAHYIETGEIFDSKTILAYLYYNKHKKDLK